MHPKYFKKILKFLLGIFILLFFFHSCIDESISTDPSLRLSFSKDTLSFDTVFTTIGSSTAKIKVYNPNDKNLKISALGLGKGAESPYKINVNGSVNPNNQFTDIELRAKDSLFVFVEVKIEPTNINSAVFVKDSLVFVTNSNQQDVKLLAYAQDMTMLCDRKIVNDTTLTAEKPYLIYGDLVVDSAKTLTLEPGCRLFFHDKASLVVYGNLIAKGTRVAPIQFRGDRTDRLFEEVPYNFISNQWGGVLLLNKEGQHEFDYVKINSGYVGIFFSNNDRNFRPKLEISNSIIHNFLKYGLVVQNGDVTVVNSEISNTGAYSVYLSGGRHTFIHTTIANYFNSTNILMQPSSKEGNAAVMVTELDRIIPMETEFLNCVIAGSSPNEFEILSRFANRYHGNFRNTYIRKEKPDSLSEMFQNVKWYAPKDTIFINTYFDREKLEYYDFTPDSLSPARDMADIEISKLYPNDLNGNNRLEDGKPDAGAYEWMPYEKRKKK